MKAVDELNQGIRVDIEVSTGSKRFEITGYNEWRKRIEVRIKSQPVNGKGNRELLDEFSRLTGKDVEIISGQKSRQKTLKIYNISKEDFLNVLDL